jgi:hypothetical protein
MMRMMRMGKINIVGIKSMELRERSKTLSSTYKVDAFIASIAGQVTGKPILNSQG